MLPLKKLLLQRFPFSFSFQFFQFQYQNLLVVDSQSWIEKKKKYSLLDRNYDKNQSEILEYKSFRDQPADFHSPETVRNSTDSWNTSLSLSPRLVPPTGTFSKPVRSNVRFKAPSPPLSSPCRKITRVPSTTGYVKILEAMGQKEWGGERKTEPRR